MPLHNPNGHGYSELPYSLKLAIVESNCTGCPFFHKHKIEDDTESEYGCSFPTDIALLNSHIREPYLTVSEIASNTCDFWKNRTKWELETVDATEGDWNDPATVRKSLRYLRAEEFPPQDKCVEYEEIIPHLQFTDNKE
jgi:hypothetical protein